MKIQISFLIKIITIIIFLLGLFISAWIVYRYYSFNNLTQSGLAINQELPKLNDQLIEKFLNNFNQTNNAPTNWNVKNVFNIPVNSPTKE